MDARDTSHRAGYIPLFKGATRIPTIGGVPLRPLLFMLMVVASLSMLTSLWCWLLAVPAWVTMAAVTRSDDRAFRILALAVDTRFRNSWRFWRASSYAPMAYDKKRLWSRR